ncbi:hypothetical protein DH2020_004641 [Rehmannia glutinosa]|uniref:Long-chain-alcohol oxidase n=1 Tax=Rehmannia glutinosa TaxID=99300 RepID=A0ABR0XPY6_REHGL
MGTECHPLLRGGRRETKYSHGYSTSELETLASICEVLLPPISLSSHHNYPENDDDQSNKAIESFYKASGSQYPVPDEVAELVVKRGFLEGKILVGEDSKNPAWKAMDYHVDTDSKSSDSPKERPLQKGIVETSHENESTLANSLTQKGLKVMENAQRYKVKCDVVIVGSGCGGGVAAAVLASAGLKVIVLEKGNYFTSKDYSGLEGPSMNQLYESGGILSTLDGKTMILAGSTVGGGSAVNCVRKRIGVTEKCDREGFRIKSYVKGAKISALKRTLFRETRPKVTTAALVVTVVRKETRKEQTQLGLSMNGYHHGLQSRAVRNKRRWENEAEEVFGSGCKMYNKFRHQKEDSNRGHSACGSLLTPPLLIKSGLRNRNIGRNLHLHPVLMAWGYFPEKNSDIGGKVYEGGIITSVHKVGEDDLNVRALIESPILGPGQFAALCPWESGIELKNKIAKYSRTAHLFSMIRDGGNGEVLAEGRISYNLNDSDKENMKMGLRRALRILIAAGAVEVGTHQSDGQKIQCEGISEEKVDEFLDGVIAAEGPKSFVRNWTTYCSAHQMGSCRMGTSEKDGAVDENGESWEAEGLFVCDASVLPSAVGVNPMITIQTTSYCLSIKIAEKLKNGKLI